VSSQKTAIEAVGVMAVILRIARVCFSTVVLAAGVMMVRGLLFYYWSALHSFWPPPLWKSVIIVGLIVATVVALCLAVYKVVRYAISPERNLT